MIKGTLSNKLKARFSSAGKSQIACYDQERLDMEAVRQIIREGESNARSEPISIHETARDMEEHDREDGDTPCSVYCEIPFHRRNLFRCLHSTPVVT